MAINKVIYGDRTLVDLTSDTVTADKLLAGETAHDRSGASIEGTVVTTEIWTGTQAEYEAQASQIADGTVVQITDDEKAITFIEAEEVYSTDERMVGVWVNGKPLYQRTYLLNLSMPTAGSWYNTSVSMEGVERIVFAIGNGESGDTLDIQASITNSLLYILRVAGRGSSILTQVTIQYTKTADVAGSGDFVPSGAPAVHYSTDEQVVGTWVDGSTLYEKTIIFTNKAKSTGSTVLLSGTDLLNTYGIDIGNVKGKEFYVEYTPTGYAKMILTTDLYLDASDRAVIWIANENLYYAIQWGSASATMDIYLTLRYTKSSS